MRYDIRDLLGHWVKPKTRAAEMCPHACCRGRRPHPDRFPVILPRGLLHAAPERDLWAHLEKHGGGAQGGKVGEQIVRELDRRETRQKTAAARRGRAKDARASRDSEFRAHLENEWIKAEGNTRGNMLSKAGERAGVDPRSLFTGPESRVQKYASPELRSYFEDHPRVSRSEFLGGGEAQRRGARSRAEGNLLGISRSASSASPARAPVSRGRGRTDGAVRAQYRTRIAPDSQGFVVTRGGKILPGSYDNPRAAQGAMRKAINAETRELKARTAPPRRPPRFSASITPYGDLF